MTEEDRDLDAAERALGLTAHDGETPAEARLRQDWELRFASLSEFVAPVRPPDGLYARISAEISGEQAAGLRLAEKRLARMRAATFLTVAAALLMALYVATAPTPPTSGEAGRYVAVMTPEGGGPAILVDVDVGHGTASLHAHGYPHPNQGTLQIWLMAEGAPPLSLGFLQADGSAAVPVAASPGDAIAISLEPDGGSPTGLPTGDILFSGTLAQIDRP